MPLLLRASSCQPAAIQAGMTPMMLPRYLVLRTAPQGNSACTAMPRRNLQSRPLTVKKELRRAWGLTRHYLNGVQKRRER